MLIIVAQSQGELAQAVPAQDNDRVPPNGELADHYLQIFAKTKTRQTKYNFLEINGQKYIHLTD